MEASFWHKRWRERKIGFHKDEVNPLLVNNFDALKLAKGGRIFLPLCGKTRDIAWLLSKGYSVVGSELSQHAVVELFSELGIEPKISQTKVLAHYQAENIDIFVGDIFDLTAKELSLVDAVYDRAALVALPEATRGQYAKHLMKITEHAPQLLICYEYDQKHMDGPPFSINTQEVERHYKNTYSLELLERKIKNTLRDDVESLQAVWLLKQ